MSLLNTFAKDITRSLAILSGKTSATSKLDIVNLIIPSTLFFCLSVII